MSLNQVDMNEDGEVTAQVDPQGTEQEIQKRIQEVIITLDANLLSINEEMKPFQDLWDKEGMKSIAQGFFDGFVESGSDVAVQWSDDISSTFDAGAWDDLGKNMKDMLSSVWNCIVNFGAAVAETAVAVWGWFVKLASGDKAAWQGVENFIKKTAEKAKNFVEGMAEIFDLLTKLYRFRKDILAVPQMFAKGDANGIQKFVEGPLQKINIDWHNAVKNSQNFEIFMILLQDPEILPKVSFYIFKILGAIPPNFYAYVLGAAALYIVVEIVITVVVGVLTAGAGLAARAVLLVRRFETIRKTFGATQLGKALQIFINALQAIFSMIERVFFEIGTLMQKVRSKTITNTSTSRATAKSTQKTQERSDKEHCKICHKDTHQTPKILAAGEGSLHYN